MNFLPIDEAGWEPIEYKGYICDKNEPEESEMLGLLAAEDQLFVNFPHFYVICNDVFYWGTADMEPIQDWECLHSAFYSHIDDPKWGTVVWCMKQRWQRPQEPVVDMMKEQGVWEEWMDDLPTWAERKALEVPPRPPGADKFVTFIKRYFALILFLMSIPILCMVC